MRITEKDILSQCEQLTALTGRKVKMWSECGLWFCGFTDEHNAVCCTLTDRDSKKVVYYQMAKMINLLNFMGYKKMTIHYGE